MPSTADDLSFLASDSEEEIEFDDDFVVHGGAGNAPQTSGTQGEQLQLLQTLGNMKSAKQMLKESLSGTLSAEEIERNDGFATF